MAIQWPSLEKAQQARLTNSAISRTRPPSGGRILTRIRIRSRRILGLRDPRPVGTLLTVRLRQRVTKGAGSRAAGLAMAFKLLDAAQQRWRRVNAPHLVAVVRASGVFVDGVLQERPASPDGSEEANHRRDAA